MVLRFKTRMQVRQLVADTFERIVLYHRGTMPDSDAPAHIAGDKPPQVGLD